MCELLYFFFKSSLDRLPPDTGLFEGPKPVLLNLNSVEDLVLLLLGNQRTTTQIEFGAHQVVLVRNEEARENMPEDLRAGLVMTVFEAKGLEFDDVCTHTPLTTDDPIYPVTRLFSSSVGDSVQLLLRFAGRERVEMSLRV